MSEKVFRMSVNFRGRVQGVGFRWNVRDESTRHQVAGYMKNLPGGSVEMVAESAREKDVKEFLAAIEARMVDYISDRSVIERTGSADFAGFEITY
jgi:acylphosphatase